ncbi:MAG TPA: molecular chaperone DnaJ [Polyangiaceae bacterium]|jgi:hypothetical protein
MIVESCVICGGDGRITNAFRSATCPGCGGSGRRAELSGLRDVTKTKPSHHRPQSASASVSNPNTPSTATGIQLAREVEVSPHLSNESKSKLAREIVEHEASHGLCTKTFTRKIRKQLAPAEGRPKQGRS